jgi:hypothetical protein
VVVAIRPIEQSNSAAPVAVGRDAPALFRHGHTPPIVFKQLDCFHRVGKICSCNYLKTSGLSVGVEFKGVSGAQGLILPVERMTPVTKTALGGSAVFAAMEIV